MFTLPYSLAELDRRVRNGPVEDGDQLVDMLIPLTQDEAVARRDRLGGPDGTLADRDWFTCRHWDETTRLCTIYPQRPHMCRDYPYEAECEHGCGYRLPRLQRFARQLRLNHPVTARTFPA